MEQTFIALLGGLFGSILTVVVTKIFELTQEKNKHKFHLQQRYFDRKLLVAEKAASQFTLLTSSLSNLAMVCERLPNQQSVAEEGFSQQLIDAAQANIQKIADTSYELANSVFIYFDIEENSFWDAKPIRDFYDKISEMDRLTKQLASSYTRYNFVRGSQEELVVLAEINQIEKQLSKCYNDVSDLYENGKNIYLELLRKIRIEMRNYEPLNE
jgi:hypothetical protein